MTDAANDALVQNRRRKARRIIFIILSVETMILAGAAVGVGLGTGSFGWAVVAIFIAGVLMTVAGFVVVAVTSGRAGLAKTGRLWRDAYRNTHGRQIGRKSRKE